MERSNTNITLRKDGRFMGKFIVGYDDEGKAQYQYVVNRCHIGILKIEYPLYYAV